MPGACLAAALLARSPSVRKGGHALAQVLAPVQQLLVGVCDLQGCSRTPRGGGGIQPGCIALGTADSSLCLSVAHAPPLRVVAPGRARGHTATGRWAWLLHPGLPHLSHHDHQEGQGHHVGQQGVGGGLRDRQDGCWRVVGRRSFTPRAAGLQRLWKLTGRVDG